MNKFPFFLLLGLLWTGTQLAAGNGPVYQRLKEGEVKPRGWIREQLIQDLHDGYYGKFDQLTTSVSQELFVHQDRMSDKTYQPGGSWWSGEHEGYWKDGVLRMAFLTDDPEYKARAIGWLDDIVKAVGPDGYIGIYKAGDEPNTRFRHLGDNGELWTQSRLFQALIAGYEFTGDPRYFQALKKAVDLTMDRSPASYFAPPKDAKKGGVSHGIGFFETLYYLYDATRERRYADFAVRLYKDFNESTAVRDNDLNTANLLSEEKFKQHGAHITEGFEMPYIVAALTGDAQQKAAAERALEKLKFHLTPTGAMVCDEAVRAQPGTSENYYEYCSNVEMLGPFNQIIALTGNLDFADVAEKMALNAGQGARLPVLKALTYVTKDNRLEIAPTHGDRGNLSPVHQAVCCALNGGRLMPYYVEGMWMKEAKASGLVSILFGPCQVNTNIGETPVQIEEETNYPFSDEIRYKISPSKPLRFPISVRIPSWADDVKIDAIPSSEIKKEGRLITIDREWTSGSAFTMKMVLSVKRIQQAQDVANGKNVPAEFYLQRGPLTYAYPFPATLTKNLQINESGMWSYTVKNEDETGWKYSFGKEADFKPVNNADGDLLHPYAKAPVSLQGTMLTPEGKPVAVKLGPEGCTILRRVTFPEVAGD